MKASKAPKGERIRRIALYAAIALFAIALIYLGFSPRPVVVETTKVVRERFEERIRSEGRLRSKDIRLITAFADGRLGRVALRPGDTVAQGETITTLYWDRNQSVRSPIHGTVSQVFRESAGPIGRAEPIIEIVNPDELEVVVELLTTDAVRVPEGAEILVEVSPDRPPLATRVSRVSKAGFIKRSALGVEEERTEIIAEIPAGERALVKRLGHNYHVETSIVVSTLENALTLPLGTIFRQGDGYAVYRVASGKAVLTPIQIERRGLDKVVLSHGLSEGDTVVLYPSDQVRDGSKLKVK